MDPKKTVKVAYDEIGSRYEASRRTDSRDVELLHLLTDRLEKSATVMDAGCGSGYPVTQILAKDFRVVGLDLSREQVNRAKRKVPGANFVCADLVSVPFKDSSFDAIISFYAIIHVPRDQHRELLRGFYRILKPKGLAFLCMGAGDLPRDTAEYHGHEMFWSHYDSETNLEILLENKFAAVWSEKVRDPTDSKAVHFFVLAQKQ